MKKYAAAAIIAALALTGCANIGHAYGPPVSASQHPNATGTPISRNPLTSEVRVNWIGNDVPDEHWIETAAMLACKQIIGGFEPRVVSDHPENNEVVVAAAEAHLCEIDR